MRSSLYEPDEGEDDLDSPLSRILHPQLKPLPFDRSPAREADIALIGEALKLHPGREKMGTGAAKQILDLQRDRERRAVAAKKAKAYYAKRKAARGGS